ncbi:MAG TPA: ABC transporter ATP-binding protein [Rhodospirillales bacterium]|nr:ABC transporter ATP-binding protein [Rhodospirillales bacterium]HIL74791.1 ABC transporter ATP-binding protein [Rhodospirillales bacterium]
MLLNIEEIDVRYGRNHAVKDVSLNIADGEIVTVLGANGAGKSSLLKAIQGTVKSTNGSIIFKGENINRWSAPKRVQSGLVMVPEGRQIFISMTVEENLLMGAYSRKNVDVTNEIETIFERFPNLKERRNMSAAVLSGGEQQMLAISRALLARPTVIMLDEPSLGLSPILVKQLFELIKEINSEGLSILLVEQNTHMALQYADRGYVLELGNIVASGTPADLLADEKLAKAYLGGD